MQQGLPILDFTLTTALGRGREAQQFTADSALRRCDYPGAEYIPTWIGRVAGLEDERLPGELVDFDCRNHKLAQLTLNQDGFLERVRDAVNSYGAKRVGVIVGTSTSGIEETEKAYRSVGPDDITMPDWYRYYSTHNIGALARFVQALTGARGYSLAISTACSSSNKVFASAARALAFDLCDVVVVGGVDSLCLTTLCGFTSLQLTSENPCRPCDTSRDGISIGEAGGFALLGKSGDSGHAPNMGYLLGYGESSDAHHMSSPHPEGKGAYLAMQQALQMAGLDAQDVGYVNLHGTGTKANDVSECLAIDRLLGREVPVSSTKGYVGHTLGAAGVVESLLALLSVQRQLLPANRNLENLDSEIAVNVIANNLASEHQYVLANSFGFGGNNSSLLLAGGDQG